ncbi:hypothetical protein LBMAG49_09270 [Planctomycetota bacterium]|nr:hypothetical protein LBMAG49_09270 [Planctomycetota bacterium]
MRHALVLFLLSLSLRLALLLALPSMGGWFAPAYQGDAKRWQELASADALHGNPEAILPFRPPAMTWLVQLLADGDSVDPMRTRYLLLILGAAIAPLVYLALRRSFNQPTALLAAYICAFSHSLIVLGSGVHSEIPYLFLFVLSLHDWDQMRYGNRTAATLRWSLLQALACLFRADHVLTIALQLGWLIWQRGKGSIRTALIALATICLSLAPWQWHAYQQIQSYNREPIPPLPAQGMLPFDEDALAELRSWPAFAQGGNAAFLSATVMTRRGTRITRSDLAILDEAYGSRPESLRTPLIALYGPLNCFLGNSRESDGSFTQAALDRAPPLLGGTARYPNGFLQSLPRNGSLVLGYPPHLAAINHGYLLACRELLLAPMQAAVRVLHKLCVGWQGAASGIGNLALPIGTHGPRRAVDFVTPEGVLAATFRCALFALALLGYFLLRGKPASAVYLLWLLGKAIVLAVFFGYARIGALAVPALALLWATAIVHLMRNVTAVALRRISRVGLLLLALVEITRLISPTVPTIDGAPFTQSNPVEYGAHVVRY